MAMRPDLKELQISSAQVESLTQVRVGCTDLDQSTGLGVGCVDGLPSGIPCTSYWCWICSVGW
ncbi:MAG: hypothetical protein ACUVRV_12280 [Cyanobacteriota bacterium]